ncbi:cell division topological specificity factor MinE [Calderihabitans maritimus]|uniref:cell division topological specificity factor MinE n=1 Tax=Calderihabitans maritimus TaxID=1246530 RepID=UPI000B501C80
MLEFLQRFFGRDTANSSKQVAKERLRLVLVHDRTSMSPHILEALKEDLIKVISNYMEIDEKSLEVSLNREADSVALVANIPVIRLKRSPNN